MNDIYEFYLENVKGYPKGHKVPIVDFKVYSLPKEVQKAISVQYCDVYISSKVVKHIDESRPKVSHFIFENIYELLNTKEIFKNIPMSSKQKRADNSYLFRSRIERGYCIIVSIVEENGRNEISTIMTYNEKTIKKLEPFRVPVLDLSQNGTTTLENKSPFRPSGSEESESMLS